MQGKIFTCDSDFRIKAMWWANQFDQFAFYNINNLKTSYAGHLPFNCILAAGASDKIECNSGNAFSKLEAFYNNQRTWTFGYLGYDLKNEIETLKSNPENKTGFPDLFFFTPKYLLNFGDNNVEIINDNPDTIYDEIISTKIPNISESVKVNLEIQQDQTREEYLNKIDILKNHLKEGDIYEINYCMEFFVPNAIIEPIETFQRLSQNNPMPYSVIIKNKHLYLLSSSPERFIKKENKKLISQPMKGTSKRGKTKGEDEILKNDLSKSEKERAENMMIVDLVRNDLARSSNPGTVKVEEMFGVYSLSSVHQMVSTISSEIKENIDWIDAIKNAFPMGSMTGAPKIKAMQLIDQFEINRRGVYSGAAGYISPEKDFDFNVIIRSIIYNNSTKYLSFNAGSAITYDSIPEKEYEECLLKAESIKKTLTK